MRSSYYRTSTIGHNTIVIDGQSQPPTSRAVITSIRFADKFSVVVMDLSTAYPSAVSASRGFALIDRRHVLIVDEIVPNRWLSSVDWQMHTAARVELGYRLATLTYPSQSDNTEPNRFFLWVVNPPLGSLSLGSAALRSLKGRTPTQASQSSCSVSSKSCNRCASRSCCHLRRTHIRGPRFAFAAPASSIRLV
jgi:hypothetical protein